MSKKLNSRAHAAKIAWQIIDKGQSLDAVLSAYFEKNNLSDQDRGLVQELVYGVCRWYGALDNQASGLLAKPIRNKDRVVHFVLLVGLYQIEHIEIAEYAAVAETVAACQQLGKPWAKNLINGCLRTHLRSERSPIDPSVRDQLAHPAWITSAIEKAWPEHSTNILAANNRRPPMCLRINARHTSPAAYLTLLEQADIAAALDPYSEDGIILDKPVPVARLPKFDLGWVSVQDTAAQIACSLLDAQPGQHVLDACAAPGGKTAHLLERTDNKVIMHALDISERRCEQLHGTLVRLNLSAEVFAADARKAASWPVPDTGYDRILIDAPCSGLGVIRRHPDIKHHRRPTDIQQLNDIQTELMSSLWKLLKPGGKMLYMTCSILPSENQLNAENFYQIHTDANCLKIAHPSALELDLGVQTLPGIHDMDGFYYCLFQKSDA